MARGASPSSGAWLAGVSPAPSESAHQPGAEVASSSVDIPETRTYRSGEVAQGDERSVGLALDGQLRQRPRGGPRNRDGPAEDVELRLVARTDERLLRRPAAGPGPAAGHRRSPIAAPPSTSSRTATGPALAPATGRGLQGPQRARRTRLAARRSAASAG